MERKRDEASFERRKLNNEDSYETEGRSGIYLGLNDFNFPKLAPERVARPNFIHPSPSLSRQGELIISDQDTAKAV